jgi:hypothetical protein
MNLKYIHSCLTELQNALQGTVTFEIFQFFGLKIRVFWMYKEKVIHWQYVVSLSELELVNDNSAFILYLIEKAKGEYALQKSEIDNDRT